MHLKINPFKLQPFDKWIMWFHGNSLLLIDGGAMIDQIANEGFFHANCFNHEKGERELC